MNRNVDPDFFRAEAALQPDLPCYVERRADTELLHALRKGKFTFILSSRKVGKSSLLERAFANLQREGVCVVKKELAEADRGITEASWYAGLIEELVNDARRRNGFEVDASWRTWWKDRDLVPLGQRFTDFLRTFFLERSNQQWVIAIDEIDTTIPLSFSDDFFAAIRRCQNARAGDPLFNRLTFLLAGVASPSQLIKDNRRTPFNIGYAVNVTDFTAEEAQVLLTGLGEPVAAAHPALLRVLHWTGGHPFLTQKVFLKLAENLEGEPQLQLDWEQLVDQAVYETFLRPGTRVTEPHLEDIARRRIGELDQRSNPNLDPELKRKMLSLYQRALGGERIKDEAQSRPYVELKLSGLLVPPPEDPSRLIVRNLIYRTVFDAVWVQAEMQLKADTSRIIKYAPAELIGRESEIALLNNAWAKVPTEEKKRPHILTFVALGGEGKTSLVAKWVAELASQNWPGCDAAFAWSFYSQGTRDQMAASSDLFLKEALNFFGDDDEKEFAASNAGAFEKGQRLARIVGERRALLILDGLEPLQYAPTSPTPGELKDSGIAALLKGLAANSRGLCVITTRYTLPDLRAFISNTVHEIKLTRLSTDAGVALLQSLGVKGSSRKTIRGTDGEALWNEYEKLVEDVKGHALTLNLVGTYLRDAHAGDIRKRDLIRLEEADAQEQGGRAFHVMDAYVHSFESGGKTKEDKAKGRRALALLQLLGLFDRPATADSLEVLWQGKAIAGLTESLIGLSEAQRNLSLKRLEDAKLLTVIRAEGSGAFIALDAHPLLREYFARRIRQLQPEAWRAAHRRLYEHLSATTPDKPDATLEDLKPLYQAVAHGCEAGLQQEACGEVYWERILRGNENYSINKLGSFSADLGAVACFFEFPWSYPSTALSKPVQAWLLNQAAFRLLALGRLPEALEPMRAGLEMGVQQENWKGASVRASNLSELELTLGAVAEALKNAEQSVTYADRSADSFQRISKRATHAVALHQGGRRAEAEARFREAERTQAESQPDYLLLYSVQGFQYCDLLLAEAERTAWQMEKPECGTRNAELIEACRAVSDRATQTLKWATEGKFGLLDFALDHLTLGRAALYAAILQHSDFRLLTSDRSHIDAAVSGLRRAGQQQYLPLGLLTRAWLRSLTGTRTGSESAQSDLDEAWEIAARGPMRLFLADIHLHRARLFGLRVSDSGLRNEEAEGGVRNEAAEPYPWESPRADLEAAEKLINDCGYHRRDEELADAKLAILGVLPSESH